MQEWGCSEFYNTFCKTHRFPDGKKKLSAQGSQATLTEANVSHVKAKRDDGRIF